MYRMPIRMAAVLAAVFALAGPQTAQDPASKRGAMPSALATTSLAKVPDDVAFYASSMRLGEQLEIFHKSKAFAKLMEMPAVKFGLQHLMQEMHKPGPGPGQVVQFMHAPENKDLLTLVHDLAKQEVFMYGGEDFTKFVQFAAEMNGSFNVERMMKQMQGQNDPEDQIRGLLDAIKDAKDLALPDVVIGFRLSNTDPAKTQMARLEGLLKQILEHQPMLKDRLKPFAADGATGFTMEVDGTLIPWEQIPIDRIESEKGEYQPVVDKLKAMKYTVSLVVKDSSLIINLGKNMDQLSKFGKGAPLGLRPEFAPMVKLGDKRFTSVSYLSQKFSASLATTPEDIDEMVKAAKEGLDQAPLSDGLREKIGKDIEGVAKDMATMLPKPGAHVGFEFLTSTGTEGFNYDYSPAAAPGKPLTILDQLGGNPLLMLATRGPDPTPQYKTTVKWLKVFYDHAMAAMEELAPGQVEMVKEKMQQIMPFLKRLDELTGTMLLPSMADGQSALVIDGKWESAQWHPDLDQKGAKAAMPEIGMVWSLSDADLFIKALKGYRQLANDVMELARDFGAELDEKGLPPAQTKELKSGAMYYWPLPEMGQDKQIQPNFAVSKGFIAATLSADHSERLLKSSSAGPDLARLANGKPMGMAATVDFAGTLKMVRPWVDKVGLPMVLPEIKEDGPPGLRRADVPAQVATLFEVFSSLKRFALVTYVENGATVAHYETIVEDVK